MCTHDIYDPQRRARRRGVSCGRPLGSGRGNAVIPCTAYWWQPHPIFIICSCGLNEAIVIPPKIARSPQVDRD